MPELPEVETIVRQLQPDLAGRKIISVEIFDPRLETPEKRELPGRKILSITRLGKQVCLELSGRDGDRKKLWLLFHLRMTGRLLTDKCKTSQKEKYLRLRLALDQGNLLFYDMRRFGRLLVLGSLQKALPVGIDPLSQRFTGRKLAELTAGSAQEIKPWLLRQDRLAGLGNIYASEILFASGIDPRRQAGSLKAEELSRFHRQIRRILHLAIEKCGTTFSDFQDSRGRTGSFQRLLSVYGKADQPCPSCSRPIQRIVQQQRSTFFCPACQK